MRPLAASFSELMLGRLRDPFCATCGREPLDHWTMAGLATAAIAVTSGVLMIVMYSWFRRGRGDRYLRYARGFSVMCAGALVGVLNAYLERSSPPRVTTLGVICSILGAVGFAMILAEHRRVRRAAKQRR